MELWREGGGGGGGGGNHAHTHITYIYYAGRGERGGTQSGAF